MRKKTSRTLTCLVLFTALLMVLSAAFFVLHQKTGTAWSYATGVTLLTFFYHFSMRLAVGEAVTLLYRRRSFPQDRLGFSLHQFEAKLYEKLKVKQWKAQVITAKPEQFDLNSVTPEALLHNVMQAELVHRVIMVLSFVPVLFIIPFGAPAVFIITSVLACALDAVFVMIQRYNRPRVLKLVALTKRRKNCFSQIKGV